MYLKQKATTPTNTSPTITKDLHPISNDLRYNIRLRHSYSTPIDPLTIPIIICITSVHTGWSYSCAYHVSILYYQPISVSIHLHMTKSYCRYAAGSDLIYLHMIVVYHHTYYATNIAPRRVINQVINRASQLFDKERGSACHRCSPFRA